MHATDKAQAMDIALLVPGPWTTISGGYLYDRRLVEGLRALGHRVEVLETEGARPLPDALAEASAEAALERVPEGAVVVLDGLGLPAFERCAERLGRAVGLIHHPTALETGLEPTVQAELARREKLLFPRLARLVATSTTTAATLAEQGIAPTRIGAVLPGTDPAPRARGSASREAGATVSILSIGSLIPRKGHDVLLRALARLGDLDWRLTVVGPAADRVHAEGLVALAEELGLAARVRFTGALDEAQLAPLWDEADLFALATWYEGYGMAAAEALARGIPVALTKGGAIAEVVPEDAGVLSKPGDLDGYSRALRRVLFDAELRRSLAAGAARAGAALPDWTRQADAFARELHSASSA